MPSLDDTYADPDAAFHPRRRWGRWLFLVALLLVLGLTGAYLTWARRAENRLNELVSRLRAAGEPTLPEDLNHPPIPADLDAGPDLRAAHALLDEQSAACKAFNDLDLNRPLGKKDREAIAKFVASEQDVLEKLRGLRGKTDADWGIRYQSPMLLTLLPHLNEQRSIAQVARAAAIDAHLNGDDAAALEYVRDILAVARAGDGEPFIVSHLVSIGIGAMATHQLFSIVPTLQIAPAGTTPPGPTPPGATSPATTPPAPGPATPQQVRALIARLLDEKDLDQGIVAALRGERAAILDTMRMVADRKMDTNALLGATGGTPAGGFGAPPMPRGMVLTDARLVVEYETAVLEAARAAPDYPAYLKAGVAIPPAIANSHFHFVARMLTPSLDRFILQHYRARAERRLAATMLALRLYAADHNGAYPKTLEELVPNYLPSIPKDPFAPGGQPLRYSAKDPAAPQVYSVADNGKDDEASTTPARARQVPGLWDRADAVIELKERPLVKSREEEAKEQAAAESEDEDESDTTTRAPAEDASTAPVADKEDE